jgi:hypothetical protein
MFNDECLMFNASIHRCKITALILQDCYVDVLI